MSFGGFPRRVQFTPVPNPVFGPLLEQIDDLAELKCTLRVIWLLHQKKGHPRYVGLGELLADRSLAVALSAEATGAALRDALGRAVRRGTLVSFTLVGERGQAEPVYTLNTEANRRALREVANGGPPAAAVPRTPAWGGPTQRRNIYSLYEDNIGLLSPIIAEQLNEAEELYPAEWIEDAFREAVSLNKRSWRYISRILERWEREGRGDGEPGRHPKKAGYY